eukprot:4071847-Lingulodinium_polyedra.AAC.1
MSRLWTLRSRTSFPWAANMLNQHFVKSLKALRARKVAMSTRRTREKAALEQKRQKEEATKQKEEAKIRAASIKMKGKQNNDSVPSLYQFPMEVFELLLTVSDLKELKSASVPFVMHDCAD